MPRGRKSQPAEVKEAKGNPGNRPNKVVPTDTLPEDKGSAPEWLDDDAKTIWASHAPHLQRSKLMRVTDRQAFARYCQTLSDFLKTTKTLAKEGQVYDAPTTTGGTMKRVHPSFTVQERLSKRLDALEDRFGLTPRARHEVMYRMASMGIVPPADPANPNSGDELPFDEPESPPESAVGMLKNAQPPSNSVN